MKERDMTNTTLREPDNDQVQRLQELYEQYFVPPADNEPLGPFRLVSIYDYSVRSYTTDSTVSKESRA
ncbi:MAG: hypothetical protein D6698_01500 [Gammaproteobacteria bacterium]|nr:MAG: hypothetical protein D6698_01500 [Gammaproteobacteria bacterium]